MQCTEVTREVFKHVFSVMSTLYCSDHMGVMQVSPKFHRCNQEKKEVLGLVFFSPFSSEYWLKYSADFLSYTGIFYHQSPFPV